MSFEKMAVNGVVGYVDNKIKTRLIIDVPISIYVINESFL